MTTTTTPDIRRKDAGEQAQPEAAVCMEVALERAGNGRFQLLVLFVCGIALMASISEGLNMAFVLPIARCDLSISVAEQGLINAVGFIGVILTSHLWGFLADTWGRQRVLRTALTLAFVSCCVSSLAVNSAMLLGARLAVGLSISGVQAAGISYVGEFHTQRNRSRYVTLAVGGMTVSIIYQSLLGLVILPQNWSLDLFGLMAYTPWRLFLFINGSIIGLAAAIMFVLPESPQFLVVMERETEALAVLRKVHRWNNCRAAAAAPPTFDVRAIARTDASGSSLSGARSAGAMVRLMWAQTWPLFRAPYLRRIAVLFYASFAMFVVSHGLYLWLPQILDLYYPRMDEPLTLCRAIELATASLPAAVAENA